MRRVAVTGLGAITPIGLDAPSTWKAAVAGESGIDFIQAFDASEYPVRIAGEVKGFDSTTVASNAWMKSMPLSPATAAFQVEAASSPSGVIAPSPVTATLLIEQS